MKLALFCSSFLFALLTFSNKSFSLSYYQMKKFCEKEKIQRSCMKNLKEKKSNLEKGDLIEIPVIPYRK